MNLYRKRMSKVSKNDTKSLVQLGKKLKGEACIGVVMITVQVYS